MKFSRLTSMLLTFVLSCVVIMAAEGFAFGVEWGRVAKSVDRSLEVTPENFVDWSHPSYPLSRISLSTIEVPGYFTPGLWPCLMSRGAGSGVIRRIGVEVVRKTGGNTTEMPLALDSLWVSIRGGEMRYASPALVTSATTAIDSFPLSALLMSPANPGKNWNNIYAAQVKDSSVAADSTWRQGFRVATWIPYSDGFTIWLTNKSAWSVSVQMYVDVCSGPARDWGEMNYYHVDYFSDTCAAEATSDNLIPLLQIAGLGKGAVLGWSLYGLGKPSFEENSIFGYIDRDLPYALLTKAISSGTKDSVKLDAKMDSWRIDAPWYETNPWPIFFVGNPTRGETPASGSDRNTIEAAIRHFPGSKNYSSYFNKAGRWIIPYGTWGDNHSIGDTVWALLDYDIGTYQTNHAVMDAASKYSPGTSVNLYGTQHLRGNVSYGADNPQAWIYFYRPAVRFSSSINFYDFTLGTASYAMRLYTVFYSWTAQSNAAAVYDTSRYFLSVLPDSLMLPQSDSIKAEFRAKWRYGYTQVPFDTAGTSKNLGDWIGAKTSWMNLRNIGTWGYGYDPIDTTGLDNLSLRNMSSSDSSGWRGVADSTFKNFPRCLCLTGDYLQMAQDADTLLGKAFDEEWSIAIAFAYYGAGAMGWGTTIVNRGSDAYGRIGLSTSDNPDRVIVTIADSAGEALSSAGTSFYANNHALLTEDTLQTVIVTYSAEVDTLSIFGNGTRYLKSFCYNCDTVLTSPSHLLQVGAANMAVKDFVLWHKRLTDAEVARADSVLRIRY